MVQKCLGCGGDYKPIDGPTHNYMLSSPACWEHYCNILAREYQNPCLFSSSHRYTVDAYALQHSGLENERRAYQSVRIHYVSLHLIFAHGFSHKQATQSLKQLANLSFDPLPRLRPVFSITARDISLQDESIHSKSVEKWARSAYDAWAVLKPFAERIIAKI